MIRHAGAVGLLFALLASPARALPQAAGYPEEEIHDTRVFPDESLTNIVLANHRWPNCATDQSAIQDIFRIEGARTDQERALALWKWFRILVSATGGYQFEGDLPGKEDLVTDPHKILTVYGHGQCDSMSWAMVPLWRAAGYIAFDECHYGHTIASLRYRDDDGQNRFHDLDPQRRYVHWDREHRRIGTWSMPLMRGLVHRHLMTPQLVHTLRTSLRIGETLDYRWENDGHVIPGGERPPKTLDLQKDGYYRPAPGRQKGIYAAAGEGLQSFEADLSQENFSKVLFAGSRGVARSPGSDGTGILHPEKAGQAAEVLYRIPSPYVAVDGTCDAVLTKADPSDVCRLWLSRDGQSWKLLVDKKSTGPEEISIDLGPRAREMDRPHLFTAYPIFLKAELASAAKPELVGLKKLRLTVVRQLNKRTLPNLLPGENILRITADRIAAGHQLELELVFWVNGKETCVVRRTSRFPHYFRINVPGVSSRVLTNYDQDFNNDDLRMKSLRMRLVTAQEPGDASLSESEAVSQFEAACPHPADLLVKKEVGIPETDLIQVSGFFPQSHAVSGDKEQLSRLLEKFRTSQKVDRWLAAEDLGNFPEALDPLLEALPDADIDLTLFIVKSLAQIGDKKAIGPLLAKWKRAPGGAPGTRYIPDALAAIGDPKVVPELVRPIRSCRFDFRYHIAHALGILGGPVAEETLRDLARNDPFPALRQEAEEALKRLSEKR